MRQTLNKYDKEESCGKLPYTIGIILNIPFFYLYIYGISNDFDIKKHGNRNLINMEKNKK